MPITPNASPDEFNSPFFLANEKICQEFDTFILNHKGETRGKYHAFSYQVLGKIRHPEKWEFRIKKASFTSGNLLISTKKQSLFVSSKWTAKNFKSNCPKFLIRRKKRWDFLKVSSSKKKWSWFQGNRKYVIKTKDSQNEIVINLSEQLSKLFESNEIWRINLSENELKIELRSEELHLDIIEKLIAI